MYERTLKDNPLKKNWNIPYAYLFKGDTVKTISVMQKGLDLHPNQETFYDHFADIYIALGDYDRAIQLLDRGLEVSDIRHPSMLINKAIALYKKNEAEEAEKYMMEVIDRANNGESETYYRISHYYSQTGDLDEAFKWLELAYEKHEIDMIWLKRQLSLAPIRSDPRYFDLVRRVGFPE
jgi:tetratricopeptide (TPR) repeat protein